MGVEEPTLTETVKGVTNLDFTIANHHNELFRRAGVESRENTVSIIREITLFK